MNLFEEAVIYSTIMHAGKTRKDNSPYILHPLEVSQLIATMTDDIEVITAGVLHDVVEDTDGTIDEIRERFGERVANLVVSETENKYENLPKSETWKRRKEESLAVLKNSPDIGVKMLWLADKLSNIRSIARRYGEIGNSVWQTFNQNDPMMHKWYYQSVAEIIEMDLNRTGAYKELIQHINFIWPGTFARSKEQYRKYKELSIDGLELIGKGAKGNVYRVDDELIVKVYNNENMFKDIERENALARKAFIAGIPTAISFGIVTVGKKYGSLFELVESNTISGLIAKNPDNVEFYAKTMADLARQIHNTDTTGMDIPDYMPEVYKWINGGVANVDVDVAKKVTEMLDALPKATTMIHGDFHTGNVMQQKGEYLLIDMDRLSTCNPIAELSGVYMFYVAFGELGSEFVDNLMGFSHDVSKEYYRHFMNYYFSNKSEDEIQLISKKCALLAYLRLVRRCYKKGLNLSEVDRKACDYCMSKIYELLEDVDDFIIT
ncbi:MAG: HD domain-containing protein [Lachnospiraceae bacterium]|nr:HD domain-containing protein [Lachnospiraceae bacterium]